MRELKRAQRVAGRCGVKRFRLPTSAELDDRRNDDILVGEIERIGI
jgi:hypothetical protein